MDANLESGQDSQESDYDTDSDTESVCSTSSSHFLKVAEPYFKVFVRNFPPSVTKADIESHLRVCGLSDHVRNISIFYDKSKKSKGCGYVEFASPNVGGNAISLLNGSLLQGLHKIEASLYRNTTRKSFPRRIISVSPSHQPINRESCSIHVSAQEGKLPISIENSHLRAHFWEFESGIDRVYIMKDKTTNRSKCYGFAMFKSKQIAESAIERLNGSQLHGCQLKLSLASSRKNKGAHHPSKSLDHKTYTPPMVSMPQFTAPSLSQQSPPLALPQQPPPFLPQQPRPPQFLSQEPPPFLPQLPRSPPFLPQQPPPSLPQHQLLPLQSSSTICLSNLSPELDQESIVTLCEGEVTKFKVVEADSNSKTVNVSFSSYEASKRALDKLNGRVLLGHTVGASYTQPPSQSQQPLVEATMSLRMAGYQMYPVKITRLAATVSEECLYKIFGQAGKIVKVKLFQTVNCYALVNFSCESEANMAVSMFNGMAIYGRSINVSKREPCNIDVQFVPQPQAVTVLQVSNLNPSMHIHDHWKCLMDTFSAYRSAVVKTVCPPVACVEFSDATEAYTAARVLNQSLVGGFLVSVTVKPSPAAQSLTSPVAAGSYLYPIKVTQLAVRVNESNICQIFKEAGEIVNCKVFPSTNRYAIINFNCESGADNAVRMFHQKVIEGTRVNVSKKSPRQRSIQSHSPSAGPLQYELVQVSNLNPRLQIHEHWKCLRDVFRQYKSAKVEDVDPPVACVKFGQTTEAYSAVKDLNHSYIGGTLVEVKVIHETSAKPCTGKSVNVQELIRLSSAQCNLLTAVNPAGSSLYQELVQPFKTNPNVKIELLLAEVAVRFTGQREAVQSAHSHFKSHFQRCVPIELECVQTMIELYPDLPAEMTKSYGVALEGFHMQATLLMLDGPQSGVDEGRRMIDNLIASFQKSVECTSFPVAQLQVSLKKKMKNEGIFVHILQSPGSPHEITIYSFSPEVHGKAQRIVHSKPFTEFVPFNSSLKEIPLSEIEAKFSVAIDMNEAEKKVYIKGFMRQDVSSAQIKVSSIISQCVVKVVPFEGSHEQRLYLKRKLETEREATEKVLNTPPVKVIFERKSGSIQLKGSPKDIAMSQKQLLEGPLLCGLQSQSFTFTAQDKFFLQLEKHVLRPMKKEHPGFEYVRSDLGGDPSPRKGRRGSARGEESEFTVTVLSQEPEVFEKAVATLEDVTPCVQTLSLAHSNAMDCMQKHIEEHEHKYRVRIVVPKDSNTRLLIFGLTEREAAQCLNELRESVESTVEAEKYVKIDHNQVSYFKQKKSEEWEELRGMCMSFKVFDKQKQEKGTALIRVEGTVRQVKAVCQRLSAMRELSYFSRSFTVSIERRYNKMWLKFWQAVIKEREENLDLIVVVDSSNEIEYEFSVCGGDENGTIEIEKEFTDPQTVQKSLPHSEVAVKELEKGIKEKKLGLDQYYVDVYIDTKGSKVILTAPAACKDDLEAVEGEIEQYVSHRTLADREIAVNDPVLALVFTSKSKSSPHLAFANQLSKPYGVSVQSLRHPQCGLRLRGSQDSLNQVESLIRQKVIEAIQSTIGETKFPVSSSLLPFFETPDFVHFSAKIRDELYVLCTFPKARGENEVIKSAFLTTANPDCRIKLEICKGDMINEEVDAIVNAANEDLQHVGGLAKAIAQAGGSSIQMESDVHIKQHGKLRAGEVVCLGAGHLACKKVLHTVGPQWEDGRSGEEQTLYFAVLECLKLCQREGLESVTFPAVSTGIFMVPDRVCIQASLKAVRDFCQVTTKSCVTHIRFVLCHSDVAKRFALALDSDIMLGCIIPRTEVTSSPGAPQGHTWEWMADDGSFVPYQQDVSSLLSNKYSKDPGGQVLFSVGKHTYTVVLNEMSQVNLQTFRQRQIRRVPAALTPSSPTSIQWKFVNDHQRWTPYSPSDSQAIEAMHQSKVPGQLTVKGRTYTFDFTQMRQINTETSYKRPIQRSILNPPPEVDVPHLPVEKKERKVIFTLRGPRANLTVAKKRLDEKLEGALANGDITFPSSLEKKVLSIVQQYKLDFNTKSVADQKGKKKRVTFNGLSSSVSKATSAIQEEIINYHVTAAEQSAVELPPEWEPQTQNLQLCQVVHGSPEWNRVVGNFHSTLPSVRVIGVTRIQNKWLWERYVQHKQRLAFKNSGRVNERELFHGTRANDPKLIYEGEDGFDMRYSSAGMWGLANYFTVNAGYSDPHAYQRSDGSKDMFMVKVLTGDSYQCSSNQNLRMPPEKQPEAQGGGLQFSRVRYDTVTGITRGSQVFMTYDNDKAYPAYLIQYN